MDNLNLTQEKLRLEFLKRGIEITIDGIKSWTKTASHHKTIPSDNKIEAMAEIFGVDYLSLKNKNIPTVNPNVISIPVFEAVAGCGGAGLLEQLKLNKNMDIDRRLLPLSIDKKALALIRIIGDSMEPYLNENDWAIIQLRHNRNAIFVNSVYLVAHGDNVQIKRCQFKPDGSCLLISDNKTYPDEVAYAGDWDIMGKVLGRIKIGSGFEFKE
jgi:phage repressor protein C with HTH and peptisase S24 domain